MSGFGTILQGERTWESPGRLSAQLALHCYQHASPFVATLSLSDSHSVLSAVLAGLESLDQHQSSCNSAATGQDNGRCVSKHSKPLIQDSLHDCRRSCPRRARLHLRLRCGRGRRSAKTSAVTAAMCTSLAALTRGNARPSVVARRGGAEPRPEARPSPGSIRAPLGDARGYEAGDEPPASEAG